MRDRHESLEQVQVALQEEQFELYFQPKVDLFSRPVSAAEFEVWYHNWLENFGVMSSNEPELP